MFDANPGANFSAIQQPVDHILNTDQKLGTFIVEQRRELGKPEKHSA
jgi:hypothetical protein